MTKKYNKYNFFKHTFCEWKSVEGVPNRKADYISKSGSRYFFTEEGVFRIANHWGRAANCRWRLISPLRISQTNQIGYANWSDFYPNNDIDLLYFIEVNWENKTVCYQHKFKDSTGLSLYRSSLSTVKRIQLIKTVFENNSWAKHLDYDNLEVIKRFMVERLVDSNDSMIQIKQAWNNGQKE